MIYLKNLNKQFNSKIVLKNVNFHLLPKERVGLVGENGAGKTTLFRIIMRTESADSGQVTLRKGSKVATLEQELGDFKGSVFERVLSGDSRFQSINTEMGKLERKMSSNSYSEEIATNYGKLQYEFAVEYQII